MNKRIIKAAVATVAAGALFAAPVLPASAVAPGDYDWFLASVTQPSDVVTYDDNGSILTDGTDTRFLLCDTTGKGDEPARWQDDGTWLLEGVTPFSFGSSYPDYPICGDWDGDGIDTVGVVRGNQYFLASSNTAGGGSVTSFRFGRQDDLPLVGDWDGDGDDTVGLRRGQDYFFASANRAGGGTVSRSSFGRLGDWPVVGDWDGNDSDTVGLRRGNVFYLSNQRAGTAVLRANVSLPFGRASDAAVSGTLAGDAATRVGVVRTEQ